jgi:ribosome-binding factor A
MPREFTRKDRVSDAIQRELSQLIRNEIRDPRLKMTNITSVEVSRDLSNAKVFVTFVGSISEEQGRDVTEVLNGAAGFLRTKIATGMQLRIVPKIKFIYDNKGKKGHDLAALIEKSIQLDEQKKSTLNQNKKDFEKDN